MSTTYPFRHCIRGAGLAVLLVAAGLSCQQDHPAEPSASRDPAYRQASSSHLVHVIYLVPSDREVRKDYARAIERAIEHLQIWYAQELGTGESFSLAKPVVEVQRLSQPASYYTSTTNFFLDVLFEAFALTGGSFFDPDDIWIYYIDADPACNQGTGAAAGVALLPANDLRGLAGEPVINVCTGEVEPDLGVCRWVGGLGHELGHAFGLPHPPECEPEVTASCPHKALLWLGYLTYPDAFLTAADRATLAESPFFEAVHVKTKLPDCGKVPGGAVLATRPRCAAHTLELALGRRASP
jgi:hypothetical protein